MKNPIANDGYVPSFIDDHARQQARLETRRLARQGTRRIACDYAHRHNQAKRLSAFGRGR